VTSLQIGGSIIIGTRRCRTRQERMITFHRDLLTDQLLDHLHLGGFVGCRERNCDAFESGPAGAADPVDIGLR